MGNQGFFVDLFSLWCLRIGFKEIFLNRFLETLAGSEDKEGAAVRVRPGVCVWFGICQSGKLGVGGGVGAVSSLSLADFPHLPKIQPRGS